MEVLLALASGVLYAAGIYLMLRRRLAQLIIGLGLLSNGTNLLDLHCRRVDAGAAARRCRWSGSAGASVRRSGAAGARAYRDRDRLRLARVLTGAGASCPRHDRH